MRQIEPCDWQNLAIQANPAQLSCPFMRPDALPTCNRHALTVYNDGSPDGQGTLLGLCPEFSAGTGVAGCKAHVLDALGRKRRRIDVSASCR